LVGNRKMLSLIEVKRMLTVLIQKLKTDS